ncbi:MAG: hypothetical protein NTY53_23150 [Kiritimatiellaeota bacterium]|nr:hypothetical protein [Kiritimatiellota bacterium]
MIAFKDFNRAARKHFQLLPPKNAQQAITLRPKNPIPPFVWLAESELQHIKNNGGGIYEIAAWLVLVRKANSKRSPEFKARIRELAKSIGCHYRKAGPLLNWLENIGLLQINRSCDANGSFYRLGTIYPREHNTHRNDVPKSSVAPAQVTSVPHTDSLQEEESIKSLQERSEAAAALRVFAAHAPRQLSIPPASDMDTEIEPHPDKIARGVCAFRRYK